MTLKVPRFKHHGKSVGGSLQSFAYKTAQENPKLEDAEEEEEEEWTKSQI